MKKINVKDNFIKSIKMLKWYEIIMIIIMLVIASLSLIDSIIGKSTTPLWLVIINFISAIAGLMCVFLCTKGSVSNFIFGIINTITYATALYTKGNWGSFSLEAFVYLPIGIVSWAMWDKHRDESDNKLTLAKRLNIKQLLLVFVVFLLIGFLVRPFLIKINGKDTWFDTFIFSAGLIAVMLKMFRFKEQYYFYFLYNGIAVIMFIMSFDMLYLTKKSIYLIVTVLGIIRWRKLNLERNMLNR